MNDQERAKAAVEILERLTPWSQDHKKFIEATEFLRPIAAGTHVIVPIEPDEVIIDAMRDARRNCSTSRIGGQTIEANYKTEMIVEFSMYAAMIAASQEGE